MPTLFFADLETFRRALASGGIPLPVSRTPAVAGFDAQGRLWLQPHAPLTREAATTLQRLGVQVFGNAGVPLTESVDCWQRLLPLVPQPRPPTDPQAVLFDVPGAGFGELANEVLRLGGTLSWRWLTEPDEEGVAGRVLVRVERLAYFTLLRAGAEVRAYAEVARRVWAPVGWTHPLANQLVPPAGQWLLIHSRAEWERLPDEPFTHGTTTFAVPAQPLTPEPPVPVRRLGQVVRMAQEAVVHERAELWILRERPAEQLAAWVQQHNDTVLAHFAAAWATSGTERILVIRQVPHKTPTPEVVFAAEAYGPYLKLPNLFVPAHRRLQPVPRRDVLRTVLALHPQRLVWLAPTPTGFRIESVRSGALMPVLDWVQYQVAPVAPLSAVVRSNLFALPAFTQREEEPPDPVPLPRPALPRPTLPSALVAQPPSSLVGRVWGWMQSWWRTPEPLGPVAPPALPPTAPPIEERLRELERQPDTGPALTEATPSNDWQKRRQELERKFLDALGPLEAGERLAVWPELAAVYAALGNLPDARLCWLNALWEPTKIPPLWAYGWLRAEAKGTLWNVADGDLGRWLADPPTPAGCRTLAAYAVWAAQQTPPPADLLAQLGRVQQVLETHESFLPARAAWLARWSLSKLAGGDVLGLARTRDRLLERLGFRGLSLDQDLPSFLRFAERGASDRFQAVREWLSKTRAPLHAWVVRLSERTSPSAPLNKIEVTCTCSYIDLLLAWGLARLGELQACALLQEQARAVLANRDEAHAVLYEGFAYRIRQALDGKTSRDNLPAALVTRALALPDMPRYMVNKLREKLRILEPLERVSAYDHTSLRQVVQDEVGRRIIAFADFTQRNELIQQVRQTLELAATPSSKADVLRSALELATRLGESEVRNLLGRVTQLLPQLTTNPLEPAQLLECSVRAATEYQLTEAVKLLTARFSLMLGGARGQDTRRWLLDPHRFPTERGQFQELIGMSFRGLRRLGLRVESERLLKHVVDWIEQRHDSERRSRKPDTEAIVQQVLLHIAGGWYYLGRTAGADAIVHQAKELLFRGGLEPHPQMGLARTYAATLGQARPESALVRATELFERLNGIQLGSSTNTHYTLPVLELVETVVLAVVHDDFTLGPVVRRWLDDDEHLIRQRIFRDLQPLLEG